MLQIMIPLFGSSSASSPTGGPAFPERLDQLRDSVAPDRRVYPVGYAGIGNDLGVPLGQGNEDQNPGAAARPREAPRQELPRGGIAGAGALDPTRHQREAAPGPRERDRQDEGHGELGDEDADCRKLRERDQRPR